MVQVANEVAGFGGDFGGKLRCLAWITTPFFLERAYPSKDGDAKPWALTFWAGCVFASVGKVARLPKGSMVKNPSVPGVSLGPPHDPGTAE
jgi:hypothetical protein